MTVNLLLSQALAIALAASQIFTQNHVQTSFNASTDQQQILQIMELGCKHVLTTLETQYPELKGVNPEDLIDGMINDANSLHQSHELIPGIQMEDAKTAYQMFCQGKAPADAQALMVEMISFYNSSLNDLPDVHSITDDFKLPEFSQIYDAQNRHLADVYHASRREYVKIENIPVMVQNAFIAAEDKDFYKHHGIDEGGLIRAGYGTMNHEGKNAPGGSTITQQLIKNLLLDSARSYRRKLREMVLANQLEGSMPKSRILELYINLVYLDNSSWGLKLGAEGWFNKPLDQLTVAEAAFLAGLPKGPRFYNPKVHAALSIERTKYVIEQMHKNGMIDEMQYQHALADAEKPVFVQHALTIPTSGLYSLDEVTYSVRQQLGFDPRQTALNVHTTINDAIQEADEGHLQEGLAQYEMRFGKSKFDHAEGNLAAQIAAKEPWLNALQAFKNPLPDVHWPLAVIIRADKSGFRVGLDDGRVLKLRINTVRQAKKALHLYDVVYVQPEGRDSASLRFRPEVQGAVLVMENKTGRVVSMVGGFSHTLSQLNRTVHMVRSPGSTAKPMTYLAALHAGLQPNTLVSDGDITLGDKHHPFSPRDFEGDSGDSIVTARFGLEDSRNRVTTRLLTMFGDSPEAALKSVLENMRACGMGQPKDYFSAIIGGFDTSMLNMATCYATIANGGLKPRPRLYDSVVRDGRELSLKKADNEMMEGADPASLFQLRTMMQGVVMRGTAARMRRELDDVARSYDRKASIGDFIAGKTGTSQNSIDTWFIGFTNDLTIAVWVGYDSSRGKAVRGLGGGATGASVAAPIWEQILRSTLKDYPLRYLNPPTAQAALQLAAVSVSASRGGYGRTTTRRADGYSVVTDFMKVDQKGKPYDTREKFYSEPPPPPPVYVQPDPNAEPDAQQQYYSNPYYTPQPAQSESPF